MFEILGDKKHFWQWDLNQSVVVNVECNNVHFAICGKTEATEVTEENGARIAPVPNILLQCAGELSVYAFVANEDGGFTKAKSCFTIKGRPKPPEYVYTETDVLGYEALRKEVDSLAEKIKEIEAGGGGGIGATGGYYIPHVAEDGTISWTATDSTMPPVASANITGPEGKPGKDGEPGYTPQKGVDYFDGAPGKDGEPGKQGEPGYTPQKGIDYFDGKPGEPGKTPDIQIGTVETVSPDEQASASVTGSAEKPVLNLKIPRGKRGTQGEPGKGLTILGYYPTLLQLETSVLNPSVGDIYGVGSAAPYNLYSWDGTKWVDNGQLQGAKGEKGDPFTYEDFTPEQLEALKGSDANVTSENIKKALGYNPANEDDIPEVPVQSVNGKTGAVQLAYGDVGAEETGAVAKHNVDGGAHNDIRIVLNAVKASLEAFLDIDDPTFDQLSELIQKIEANAGTIEQLTNGKVNVADIVNNLATNVANKPLSAAQGVVLKGLYDSVSNRLENNITMANGAYDLAEDAYFSAQTANSNANKAKTTAQNASDKVDDLEERMNSGEFKGEPGTPGTNGVSVVSVEQTTTSTADGGENVVTVTLSNGTKSVFKFKNGSKGSTGNKGDKGNGIKSAVLNADYTLTLTFDDGTEYTTPSIRGERGPAGKDGTPGLDGTPGADGYTPVYGVDYMTPEDKAEIEAYIAAELAKRGQLAPEFAESLEWLEANGDQSKMYVLPDGFIYAYKLTKTEVEGGPSYTNLLPTAKAADRKTIYGGDYNGDGVNDGYLKNRRLSSSGSDSSAENMNASGFIPAKQGDIVRAKGIANNGGSNLYIITYNSSNSKVGHIQYYHGTSSTLKDNGYTYDDKTELHTFDLGFSAFGTGFDAFRISAGDLSPVIITVNEEITEGGGTTVVEEYKWANTNLAFVPADYGDMVADHERRIVRNTEEIAALKETVESNGSSVLTEAEKLEKIKTWDKPVYDHAEVTLIADGNAKPALTTSDRTIEAIYAKYRALMAAHPDFITETNLGKCTGSSTFTAVDMLRFDFKERDGLTQPDLDESALHETKPKLIFMSGVHTEWVGVWGLYYALEEITTNPAFDDIRRNCHIIVVPCANPFCLSNQTVSGWTTSHVNANGVAIHNNFGVDHSTSGNVGEYNYGGSAPYSELETQYIDKIMADNPDAVAFISCHNNDYSTYYGSHVIWASSATYHMCNVVFRLVDKMSKAWINKYGQTLKDAIDEYKINMSADDYRLGRATMSSSKGTEQKNALKYGIQGVNVEISRMMKIFSGNTDGTSEVMTHGAEVYANLIRTILLAYENSDKKAYYE